MHSHNATIINDNYCIDIGRHATVLNRFTSDYPIRSAYMRTIAVVLQHAREVVCFFGQIVQVLVLIKYSLRLIVLRAVYRMFRLHIRLACAVEADLLAAVVYEDWCGAAAHSTCDMFTASTESDLRRHVVDLDFHRPAPRRPSTEDLVDGNGDGNTDTSARSRTSTRPNRSRLDGPHGTRRHGWPRTP